MKMGNLMEEVLEQMGFEDCDDSELLIRSIEGNILYSLIWDAQEKKLEKLFLDRQHNPKILIEQYKEDLKEVGEQIEELQVWDNFEDDD